MLEVMAVYYLCRRNRDNARARGKNGGGAIAYTICLWIGFEIIGAFVGVFLEGMLGNGDMILTYISALVFAAIGGLVSNLISKAGPVIVQEQPIMYVQPQAYVPNAGQPYNPYQCQYCGHVNPSDSMFCMGCGKPLANAQPQDTQNV